MQAALALGPWWNLRSPWQMEMLFGAFSRSQSMNYRGKTLRFFSHQITMWSELLPMGWVLYNLPIYKLGCAQQPSIINWMWYIWIYIHLIRSWGNKQVSHMKKFPKCLWFLLLLECHLLPSHMGWDWLTEEEKNMLCMVCRHHPEAQMQHCNPFMRQPWKTLEKGNLHSG